MGSFKVTAITKTAAGVSIDIENLSADVTEAEKTKVYLISYDSFESLELSEGEQIDGDGLAVIAVEADFCRAYARALKILSYSSHSKAALMRKLVKYEFSKEISQRAADAMEKIGSLNELAQAKHLCGYYLAHKYWGKKRVAAELMSRGYSRDVVISVLNETPDEDFIANLEKLVSRRPVPDDKAEREKYISALSRMGYALKDIKATIEK